MRDSVQLLIKACAHRELSNKVGRMVLLNAVSDDNEYLGECCSIR